MLYQAEPDVPGATAEVNRLRKIIDARLTAAKVIAKVPAAPKDQQRQALNTEGLDYDMSHHYDMMDHLYVFGVSSRARKTSTAPR
jgi:hypothetical protein